jgi:hypothetical protein
MAIPYSPNLMRKIRKDPPSHLGIPTWDLAKKAIREGDKKQAMGLVDYLNIEGKRLHDLYGEWVFALLSYIGRKSENEVYPALRYSIQTNSAMGNSWKKPKKPLPLEEVIQVVAEAMRSHRSGPKERGTFTVREDEEKYTLILDPWGSGGRMMRIGELDKLPPRTGRPYHFGKTKKAHFWSWGKKGVPFYCTHCCIIEIIDIETFGYLRKIILYPEKPEKPCVWLFYKDPLDIPEVYFKQVGKKKDPSKFVSIPVLDSKKPNG